MGNYDDYRMQWQQLHQQQDQSVKKLISTLHILSSKIGIKDSEKNATLKYHSKLQQYMQAATDL